MKTKRFNKVEAVKCDKCDSVFISGNTPDGLPNGVTFQLQDGRAITLCHNCIMQLGRLNEAGDNAGVKSFWQDLGVEV